MADVPVPDTPTGTKVPEWTPLVTKFLQSRFGNRYNELITMIKETGSLISGGSILSACIGEPVENQDVDMYVPVKHIPRFLNELIIKNSPIFDADAYNKYAASFYCSSFLRKNGIRKVYNFLGRALGVVNATTHEIDVMSVRNKRGPLAVVNNFDLTFCQVWFDGTDVYASHPEHIKSKTGILQFDYCKKLIAGNRFLKNRINKYIRRGFQIKFDERVNTPEVFQDIAKHNAFMYSKQRFVCRDPDNDSLLVHENRYEDPEFVTKWFNRIAMRYLLGVRDEVVEQGTGKKLLLIPLTKEIRNSQDVRLNKDMDLQSPDIDIIHNVEERRRKVFTSHKSFELTLDDGYDSDDMDTAEFKHIADINYVFPANELAEPVSVDLKFGRSMTNLVLNARSIHEDLEGYEYSLMTMLNSNFDPDNQDKAESKKAYAKLLLGHIEERALSKGDDMFGGEGRLYHIHGHPEDAATTRDSLEEFLSGTLTQDDYDVKCYYSGGGCKEMLTQSLIKKIVSPEFFERYSAPRPKKSGLDLEVVNYDLVLRNSKSMDNEWGNIYHATMCPYCLKFEERGHGCSVMTHENVKGLPNEMAPYCDPGRAVEDLVKMYKDAAAELNDGFVRLEFCVECGRPSSGHKHFNLDSTEMLDARKVPDPRNPGELMYDYGHCPGGGRVEMIARMLAVRDVYRRKDIKDVKEERRLAAWAADAAPINEGLMKRATAIWDAARPGIEWADRRKQLSARVRADLGAQDKSDEEIAAGVEEAVKKYVAENPKPADAKFNVDVPKSKAYTDPFYADAVNNASDSVWAKAGKGGKSYKRRITKNIVKRLRKTRKASRKN
jgi:hypothetical protein